MAIANESLGLLKDAVQRVVRGRLQAAEAAVEEHDEIPADIVADMKAMGLLGLSIPQAYGGIGLPMVQVCQLAHEPGQTSLAFRSVFRTNLGIDSQGVLIDGADAQKESLLPRVAGGELIMSFALTEPDAGSDSAALKTCAVLDGDVYVISGSKRYITNAPRAGSHAGQARPQDGSAGHQDLRRLADPATHHRPRTRRPALKEPTP
jgi:acyl-CoA dehydrogenase